VAKRRKPVVATAKPRTKKRNQGTFTARIMVPPDELDVQVVYRAPSKRTGVVDLNFVSPEGLTKLRRLTNQLLGEIKDRLQTHAIKQAEVPRYIVKYASRIEPEHPTLFVVISGDEELETYLKRKGPNTMAGVQYATRFTIAEAATILAKFPAVDDMHMPGEVVRDNNAFVQEEDDDG
jgi:hypothetical protein